MSAWYRPRRGRHNYFFWLLALWDLLPQVEPHMLGISRLVGTYEP